jgi:hypothetical protein
MIRFFAFQYYRECNQLVERERNENVEQLAKTNRGDMLRERRKVVALFVGGDHLKDRIDWEIGVRRKI